MDIAYRCHFIAFSVQLSTRQKINIFPMKLSSQAFVFFTTSIGLLTINFAVSLPAKASIVCEPGTITNYSNGSLASCALGQDMTVQVSNSRSGTSTFYCKAQGDISFNEQGQFLSCYLAEGIQIRRGNSSEICMSG